MLGTPELDTYLDAINALDGMVANDEPDDVREAMDAAFEAEAELDDAKRRRARALPASVQPMPSLEEELFGPPRSYERETEAA